MSSLLLWPGGHRRPRRAAKHFMGKWQGFVEIHEYFHIYFHSFTFAVVDEKDIECEIGCRIKHFHEVPGWRNWQTQRTQNPPRFTPRGGSTPPPGTTSFAPYLLTLEVTNIPQAKSSGSGIAASASEDFHFAGAEAVVRSEHIGSV